MPHNSTGAATLGMGNGSAMINNLATVSIPVSVPPKAAALTYAERGWRVAPAPPGGKHPIIKDWPNKATTATATIASWWTARPSVNVCITTGPASGIFVLDVDDKDGAGGSATLAALERQHGDLPLTYTVGTGSGGVHHYFTYDGIDFDLRNSARKLGPGLDTRGEGGQAVAPRRGWTTRRTRCRTWCSWTWHRAPRRRGWWTCCGRSRWRALHRRPPRPGPIIGTLHLIPGWNG